MSNNTSKVDILLEAGAVIEVENRWLETPLDWAEVRVAKELTKSAITLVK